MKAYISIADVLLTILLFALGNRRIKSKSTQTFKDFDIDMLTAEH